MILITGGACQGKRAFANERFPGLVWADGRECEEADLFRCSGIHHFHAYIRRAMEAGKQEEEMEELAGRLILRNPEVVVVTDEVGCGIVPLEPFERDWREQTGRICTRLAAASRKVCRVILGIGKEIKG